MKKTILNLLIFTISLSFSYASERNDYCLIERNDNSSVFYCFLKENSRVVRQEVSPIDESTWKASLEDGGVLFFEDLEFSSQMAVDALQAITETMISCNETMGYENVYYRVDEFNRLPSSASAVQKVRELATALHRAGVCEVNVQSQNFNSINIQTPDDVLHHFLCISNSESVFGTRNIGMGGRGPWGIHPMHNQARGTRAFTGGKTVTLPRNGICYDLPRSVVRNSNGVERKVSSLYEDPEVQFQNAKCAIRLYQQKGFRDWGTGSSWGSNRHCSASTRNRLEFNKHLGADLGCCTQRCKDRLNGNTRL